MIETTTEMFLKYLDMRRRFPDYQVSYQEWMESSIELGLVELE